MTKRPHYITDWPLPDLKEQYKIAVTTLGADSQTAQAFKRAIEDREHERAVCHKESHSAK